MNCLQRTIRSGCRPQVELMRLTLRKTLSSTSSRRWLAYTPQIWVFLPNATHVGLDAVVLPEPGLARAEEAGLDLVEHEQRVVLCRR
jgi:hypothetical protein